MNDIKVFPHDEYQRGIGLRDYIAIKVMQSEMIRDKDAGYAVIAEDAYMMADAMLRVRMESNE